MEKNHIALVALLLVASVILLIPGKILSYGYTPPDDALRHVGMTPSYGERDRLNQHLAKGGHQVFETDKRQWRRELLYKGDGRAVLLVKQEGR